MKLFFLLSSLFPLTAFAADYRVEWSEPQLHPDCAQAATKIIVDVRKCKPLNLRLKVLSVKDGSVVADLDGLGRNHYHPTEIHGTDLYWVRRADETTYGSDGRPNNYIQLFVQDLLPGGKKAKVSEARELDYRVAPDGNRILLLRDRVVGIHDRRENTFVPIYEIDDADDNSQSIELNGWTSEHIVVFNVGLGEVCKKVGHWDERLVEKALSWKKCPEL